MPLVPAPRKSGSTALPDPALIEQHRFLTDSEIRLLREVSALDTWTMLTMVMYPQEWQEHYYEPLHRPLCEQLDSAQPGDRQLIILPRTHRKTYIDMAHNTRLIVVDPNVRILLISALEGTAEEMTALQKKQFSHNESFKRVWEEYAIERNAQFGKVAQFEHPLRTKHDLNPTFFSAHLGAALIGRRCDVLKLDDPIDEIKHCATPELAAKANSAIVALNPLVDVNKRYENVFIFVTLKSYNDYYHTIMDNPRWRTIKRAIMENDKGEGDLVSGQPIMPNVFTREKVHQLLEDCKTDENLGEPYFWREYMGVTMAPGREPMRAEWLEGWVDKLPGGIVWSGICLDSATKDNQILFKGDYTAAFVGHYDAHGHLYLTDAFHSNALRVADLKRELVVAVQKCQREHGVLVSNLVKEKVSTEALLPSLVDHFNASKLPLTTYPVGVRGLGAKIVRIVEALQGPLQARQIHFVGDPQRGYGFPVAIHRKLKDELTHLGQWSVDDLADALALFYHKDVRVTPVNRMSKPWTVRNVAPQQLSTPLSARAPFQGWATRGGPKPPPPPPPHMIDTEGGFSVRQVDVAPIGKTTHIEYDGSVKPKE